ncbi:effector protein [Photorhabdus sp. HUG-39]|uniref:VopS family T3SS effector adenosine monophosphate-protein transferase n=1 Tax=Photorhabdus kayaii TaxID=230088 RepID=A0ABX0AYE9_9GAMM|nr:MULTISPECIES: VopS family T3SS effector adenosine monophosphate-protein transferase [Photorhabdus]MCC8373207.1 VopS family T3SS effector adenosine monophosphate-protein transferase [Photorhabdus bodei]MDB6366241.1 VopS family T3SS effector adenosine monophosphate-protein transferase [Photorhabdus bodei]NDL10847.1 VopS family T3SS effector adenosine monophosphate-protein transferase [Photorhabdus kayaii]NDL24313.1 VopS family T3SS effector adenosine monophosphate-protein transferase [Photorha
MIEFKNLTALQHASSQIQEQVRNEGKLQIAGHEYHINADLQQVLRTHPKSNQLARFFEGVSKFFLHGSSASVAKEVTKTLFSTEGAQQQRLQSTDSVSHARMLFKDGSLRTPEQVLEKLRTVDTHKMTEGMLAEHTLLLQRTMSELLQNTETGKKLQDLMGHQATAQLTNKLVAPKQEFVSLEQLRKQPSAANAVASLEPVLMMEEKNLLAAQHHQEVIGGQDLNQGIYAEILSEESYNPNKLTDNVDRAAAWILKASSSKGNEWSNFTALLKEYTHNGKDLTDSQVLKELHHRLVPNIERDYRGPAISGGSLPSSIGGAAMLAHHLETLDKEDPQIGKQLFAAVVGFHGFTDGNGRMGRLLYALTELRAGQFSPLSLQTENALHGIH